LFLPDLLAWVETTQPASWLALSKAHGTSLPKVLAERVCKCMAEHGTLADNVAAPSLASDPDSAS